MTPKLQQFDERDTGGLRRYEYDDQVVYAVDVGLGEATVDVVGNTVMAIDGNDQAEFEVPESGTVEAGINNGVLTVEVGR
jgi:hypothetical protein